MKSLLFAAVMAAFLYAPAMACEAPNYSLETITQTARDAAKQIPGATVSEYTGKAAKQWLAAFNSVPPESDFDAEVVIILRVPNQPARMAIGPVECGLYRMFLVRPDVVKAVEDALGREA